MAEEYGVSVTTDTEDIITAIRARYDDPIWGSKEMLYPVAASTTITAERLVSANSTGYAVPAADTSGHRFLGWAMETVDNSTGADGAKQVRVRRVGVFEVAAASITQAMIGDPMYAVDDATVDDAAGTTNDIKVGVLVRYISATKGWVDINK